VEGIEESTAVLAPVEKALRRVFSAAGNVPDGLELRTEHGPQYTGGDCADLCSNWNLDHMSVVLRNAHIR
jgi:hypothetical protein